MLSLENLLTVFWELGPGVGVGDVSLSESSTDSVSVIKGFFVVLFEAIGVYSSFFGGNGSQVPSLCKTISCSSAGNRGDLKQIPEINKSDHQRKDIINITLSVP